MGRKTILIITDGIGHKPDSPANAFLEAKKPLYDRLFREVPHTLISTYGLSVGLPEGQMGNSEVGHMTIGSGRVLYQDLVKISLALEDGSLAKNADLESLFSRSGDIHIAGLMSDGGVHSHIDHITGLAKIAAAKGKKVWLHLITDGRDVSPTSAPEYLKKIEDILGENIQIATISGRFYTMDRDNRWERIKLAYDAIVYGKGNSANSPFEAIEESYKNNITDEFIIPTVILEKNKPICTLQDNDSVIFFNFRSDRARQLTRAIKIPSFKEFEHENFKNLKFVTFNEYDIEFNDYVDVAFRLPELKNILGEVMQNNKLKQLRLAETEKYAHVTFFFNGGVEKAFEGEDRILVPSPKVATYDLQPEMSAFEVKDKLVNALTTKDYDLNVTNFANCDMVGHTGVFDAAVKAVETIDICLGEILPVAQKKKYNIFITADHGNADQMLDENGNPFTAHSKNPVPFVVKLTSETKINLQNGILADIAPTILKAMKIEIPKEMTGKPLF